MNELAIFDLDHTLIGMDCELEWSRFLNQQGVISDPQLQEMLDFFEQYEFGELNFNHYIEVSVSQWCYLDRTRLNALFEVYLKEVVSHKVYHHAKLALQQHQEKQHEILLLTASNEVIAHRIAGLLGIKQVIATQLCAQQPTHIAGVASFRQGKVTRFEAWQKKQRKTFSTVHFYSDSHNDLPLLEYVDHPVCVNPDARLQQAAQEKGWPCYQW